MKRSRSLTCSVIVALLVLAAVSAPGLRAADQPTLAGHWAGAMEVQGTKLDFDLDFALAGGAWTGDITIPAQNARNLPLEGIAVEGTKVTFAIKDVPGAPTFSGELSADGLKISGQMAQGGQNFPFSVEKEALDPAAKVVAALEGFDNVAEEGLKALKVPGIAMVVIKDDKVAYARGFGFKDVEKKLPVTPDTIFAIGSSSKAFTVFALGKLVDQGKVEWDKPVRNYIPWFRLYDQSAGERLTVRDLVMHDSGLPRHDLVWYNNQKVTREELVRRLPYLQPSADLREKWQYNNLMYLTAGYLVEQLTGKKWEDAVRSLVFEPLGMKRANFSVLESQKDADFAYPYGTDDKGFKKLPFRDITIIGPAGAINASVNEMAHWALVHLNNGKFGGDQLVNTATVADMHASHMVLGAESETPEILAQSYGMGWFTDIYRGHRRFHHGGNIDGFTAMVSVLPNDGLAFVVLSNMNGSALPELLVRTAADRILGVAAKDWIGETAKKIAEGEAAQKKAEEKKGTRRVQGTKPAHALADYAGDYNHPGYGDLKVELAGNGLAFTYNGIATPLEHWHYETFNGLKADDPTFTDFKLTFRTDLNGRVAALTGIFDAAVDEIVFKKKPEARLSDPGYLKKYLGSYDLMGQAIAITLKGNVLAMSAAGQPATELVPELGGEFVLKEARIIGVRFIEGPDGIVTAMEFIQPNGIFEAKKTK
jgi:CubicO group peptidase (beta-lactamase class C family)